LAQQENKALKDQKDQKDQPDPLVQLVNKGQKDQKVQLGLLEKLVLQDLKAKPGQLVLQVVLAPKD
jgi:hypothetical protein